MATWNGKPRSANCRRILTRLLSICSWILPKSTSSIVYSNASCTHHIYSYITGIYRNSLGILQGRSLQVVTRCFSHSEKITQLPVSKMSHITACAHSLWAKMESVQRSGIRHGVKMNQWWLEIFDDISMIINVSWWVVLQWSVALSQFDTLEAATAKRVSVAAVAATAAMVCTYKPLRGCLVNQVDENDYKLTITVCFIVVYSFVHSFLHSSFVIYSSRKCSSFGSSSQVHESPEMLRSPTTAQIAPAPA